MVYGRYGRLYRRYGRYRKYRRFYRRYRRSYARRYVNASSRSTVRMKTTVTSAGSVQAGYGASATGAAVNYFQPLNGTNDSNSAANSPLYRTYCNLYEEVKMIGAKVNLSIVSAVGGSDIPSVQIYTAWDRKHGFGEAAFNALDIKNAATSNVATALNNNVAKLTRSCYASDLIEKATWFDASLDSANSYRNAAWTTAAANPNMFCPAFFYFFNCPSLGANKNIDLAISITYYFAFRNPRFGGSGSAKMTNLGARSVFPDGDGDIDDGGDMVEVEELDDGGDMDDGGAAGGDPDPPGAATSAADPNPSTVPTKRNSAIVVQPSSKRSRSLNK